MEESFLGMSLTMFEVPKVVLIRSQVVCLGNYRKSFRLGATIIAKTPLDGPWPEQGSGKKYDAFDWTPTLRESR